MKRLLALALFLGIAGCTTTRIVAPGEMAAVAPMLSVERFLMASNERDLHSMGGLVGTADGPSFDTGGSFGCMFKKIGSWIGVGDRCRTLQEVELQMDAIAGILQHQDYLIKSDTRVPGRSNPTTRVSVDFVINGRDVVDIPFQVVQTNDGLWLIENIDLEKVMR